MLDRRFVRENPELIRGALVRRGIEVDLDRLLSLDGKLLELAQRREELKSEQNRLSKQVPKLQGDEKSAAIARSKELGTAIKPLETTIRKRIFSEIRNEARPHGVVQTVVNQRPEGFLTA